MTTNTTLSGKFTDVLRYSTEYHATEVSNDEGNHRPSPWLIIPVILPRERGFIEKDTNETDISNPLAEMAADTEIKKELQNIDEEFSITEEDGLEDI